MKKWGKNGLIIILVLMNITLLWRLNEFKINVNTKDLSLVRNSNRINYLNKWKVLGKKFNLDLEPVYRKNIYKNNESSIKLMILFTSRGCGTCLRDEVIEWKKLSHINSNIELVPINIDKDKNDVFRFINDYEVLFPVYYNKNYKEYLPKTTIARIIILNKNNVAINYFDAKSGVYYEREKIYEFINKLI